jgi:hypothetical protein
MRRSQVEQRLRRSQSNLDRAQRAVEEAQGKRRALVVEARDFGLSLSEISVQLGTTRGRVAQLVKEHEDKHAEED